MHIQKPTNQKPAKSSYLTAFFKAFLKAIAAFSLIFLIFQTALFAENKDQINAVNFIEPKSEPHFNLLKKDSKEEDNGIASLEASAANAIASYAATILITNSFSGGMNREEYTKVLRNSVYSLFFTRHESRPTIVGNPDIPKQTLVEFQVALVYKLAAQNISIQTVTTEVIKYAEQSAIFINTAVLTHSYYKAAANTWGCNG